MKHTSSVILNITCTFLLLSCHSQNNRDQLHYPNDDFEQRDNTILASKIKSVKSYSARINQGVAADHPVMVSEKFYGPDGHQTKEYGYDPAGILSYREDLKYDNDGISWEQITYNVDNSIFGSLACRYDIDKNEARYYDTRGGLDNPTLKQSDRFNSHGWLIELTTYLSDDTINSQTRYIYNDLGRLIAEEFSKSHSSSYQYDDAGHLIRRNFLDSLGKIISSDSAKFDDLGRLQEKNESYFGSRTVYIYNQNGSLLKETLYSGFDTNNEIFITTYEYNSRGNKIKETRFDETTKKLIAITTYEYEYYGN